MKRLDRGDAVGQAKFVESLFGIAPRLGSPHGLLHLKPIFCNGTYYLALIGAANKESARRRIVSDSFRNQILLTDSEGDLAPLLR